MTPSHEAALARQTALWAGRSIEDQLPLEFENGLVVDHLEGHCNTCGASLVGSYFRGELTTVSPQMTQLSAVGACKSCSTLTAFEYRLYSDGRMLAQIDGVWQTQRVKLSLLGRLWIKLRRLLGLSPRVEHPAR